MTTVQTIRILISFTDNYGDNYVTTTTILRGIQ